MSPILDMKYMQDLDTVVVDLKKLVSKNPLRLSLKGEMLSFYIKVGCTFGMLMS